MSLRFELNQCVSIQISGEQCTVIGRAEYTNTQPIYLLRYVDKQGVAQEKWWDDDALEPVAAA